MITANQGGDLERISEEFTPITLKTEENTYWKDYEYGGPIQKLRPGIEVAGSTGGGLNVKMGSFTITGTGSIVITGVGFKPTYVTFTYSASTGRGEGEMTETAMKSYDPRTNTTVTSDNVYIRNGSDAIIARTQYVSMDTDGFTINCSGYSANLTVYYTAFK